MNVQFEVPGSREEAEERYARLSNELLEIDLQLGDRDRKKSDGTRLRGKEYFQWRRSAIFAKTAKQKEVMFLKEWMKINRQLQHDEKLAISASDNHLQLLHRAHEVIGKLAHRIGWNYLDRDDQKVIEDIRMIIFEA